MPFQGKISASIAEDMVDSHIAILCVIYGEIEVHAIGVMK